MLYCHSGRRRRTKFVSSDSCRKESFLSFCSGGHGKKGPMERHFEKDLNELKERLLWMGSLAERAVHQSVHAVLETDEQLAKRVLEEEDAINELQMEVDDRVVQLLALHQLMATDLRFVLAVSRINNDLERIGDQAVNIAQDVIYLVQGQDIRHPTVDRR